MKCVIFQSNISVNDLKEIMVIPETWISSLVGQKEESGSIEQNIKGWNAQEKIDPGHIICV